MNKVFFDTETSGFVPGSIGQLSIIKEENGSNISTYNYFFDIDYITDGAAEVCGRTLEFYKEHSNGIKFAQKADEILSAMQADLWVAHNLSFDEKFIIAEMFRADRIIKPAEKRLDTMLYFKETCNLKNSRGRIKNPKLSEVVDKLNIDNDKIVKYAEQLFNCSGIDYHDSRFDTTALFVIYQIENERIIGGNSWYSTFQRGVMEYERVEI